MCRCVVVLWNFVFRYPSTQAWSKHTCPQHSTTRNQEHAHRLTVALKRGRCVFFGACGHVLRATQCHLKSQKTAPPWAPSGKPYMQGANFNRKSLFTAINCNILLHNLQVGNPWLQRWTYSLFRISHAVQKWEGLEEHGFSTDNRTY